MNPSNDDFVSCSLDGTVRFWNLQSPHPRGQLNLYAPYFAAYDPSASVVAIASPPTQTVLLYDVRMFDRPPFVQFDLKEHEQRFNPGQAGRNWSKIELSNDGKSLLVGTTGAGHFVLDAFEGGLTHFLPRKGGRSERRVPGEAVQGRPAGAGDVCFSPDGRYVIGGSGGNDGLVVWDTHQEAGRDKVAEIFTECPTPSTAGVNGRCEIVGYNPRSNLICTADKDFMIWLPDPEIAP
jgi:COMPASS component SWD2